jgi:hypothetical protein
MEGVNTLWTHTELSISTPSEQRQDSVVCSKVFLEMLFQLCMSELKSKIYIHSDLILNVTQFTLVQQVLFQFRR